MTRCASLLFALLLPACGIDRDDVEAALRQSEETNAGTVADKTCGFSTFGLRDVSITDLQIDGRGSGSARVSGTAVDGEKKGEPCTGAVTFHYVEGRAVTQGVNGTSTRYVAVITELQRK